MHDQRKVKQEIDEHTRLLTAEKIVRFRAAMADAFARRDARDFSPEALAALDVLLAINPELYTMMNYRRRILLALWSRSSAATPDAAIRDSDGATTTAAAPEAAAAVVVGISKPADLERELALNTRTVLRDYKVYAAWLHRRWILAQMTPQRRGEALAAELRQCEALLRVDERNFHVWGYRRWVQQQQLQLQLQLGTDPEEKPAAAAELAFTAEKIASNFSNYSAWHCRALVVLQQRPHDAATAETAERSASDELALVLKACYCDPADQSAWLYAAFLLDAWKARASAAAVDVATYERAVVEVGRACEELVAEAEAEADDAAAAVAPWPLWMQYLLLTRHAASAGAADDARASAVLERLQGVDPARRGYYADLLAQLRAKSSPPREQ